MTEMILSPRRSGKTLELIKRSAQDRTYILTLNRQRADDLFRQAQDMGYDIPYPVTLEDFHRTQFRGSFIQRDGLYLDDADDILASIFRGIPIKGVTWTGMPKDNPYLTNIYNKE